MATPVGNPDISLLPQPSTPVAIEPMRGGFVGGQPTAGAENVSLLPQPAVPAPIQPMRGGSSSPAPENVSLLPQPSNPVPIEAMRGGGDKIPTLQLVEYKRSYPLSGDSAITNDQYIANIEKASIFTIDTIRKYKDDLRAGQWRAQLPKNQNNSRKTFKSLNFDGTKDTYVFYISKFIDYLFAEKWLTKQKDLKVNYLFVNRIKDTAEFSKTYKRFITFVIQDVNLPYSMYYLFDKTDPALQIQWTGAERFAQKAFLYLEPDAVEFTYKEAGTDKQLVWLPSTVIPSGFTDNYIAISPDSSIPDKITLQKKTPTGDKKIVISTSTLQDKTLYKIDSLKNPNYFDFVYILVQYSEIPTLVSSLPPPAPSSVVAAPPSTPVTPPPITKPAPIQYLLTKKDTIDIDLGEKIYQVRKATIQTQEDWEKGIFSPSEQELLNVIGLTDEFFKEYPTPEKDELKAGRGKFLMGLVVSSCFIDTTYLLKSECDFVRDYLQKLLEIRQMERLRAVSALFTTVDPFAIQFIPSTPSGPVKIGPVTLGSSVIPGVVVKGSPVAVAGTSIPKSSFQNISNLLDSLKLTKVVHKKGIPPFNSVLNTFPTPGGVPTTKIDVIDFNDMMDIGSLVDTLVGQRKPRVAAVLLSGIDFSDILNFSQMP